MYTIWLVRNGLCLTRQVKTRAVQTCTNGVLPNLRHTTMASGKPWAILLTRHKDRLQLLWGRKRRSQVSRIYSDYSVCGMDELSFMLIGWVIVVDVDTSQVEQTALQSPTTPSAPSAPSDRSMGSQAPSLPPPRVLAPKTSTTPPASAAGSTKCDLNDLFSSLKQTGYI